MNDKPASNLIWGARDIARFLGKTERATYHMLEQKQLPGAAKIGNQHVLDVELFRKKIAEAAA